jgi:hypothetical protein
MANSILGDLHGQGGPAALKKDPSLRPTLGCGLQRGEIFPLSFFLDFLWEPMRGIKLVLWRRRRRELNQLDSDEHSFTASHLNPVPGIVAVF